MASNEYRDEGERRKMRTYELKPTRANLVDTLSNDSIGRNIDLARFLTILNHIHSCYSIALDGKWGSGKTFFVKQAKMILDAQNENALDIYSDFATIKQSMTKYANSFSVDTTDVSQVAVYYDAWENDNDEDPLLSLILSILQCVNTDFKFIYGTTCVDAAGAIAEILSGRSSGLLIRAKNSDDPLAAIGQEQNIRSKVDELLEALLVEKESRLVIFVDELDRCNPNFAVRLLERVKHYFCNDRITFVFPTNIDALQHTIRHFYGSDFDASRYLDRFFDFRMTLPPVNLNRYYTSINFDESSGAFEVVSDLVIKSLKMEMREIAKYLSQLDVAIRQKAHASGYAGRGFELCKLCFIPTLIGLNLLDSNRYLNFVNGEDSSILIDIFCKAGDHLGFFSDLLETKETFDSSHLQYDSTLTLVPLEKRLNDVYDFVFGTRKMDTTGKGRVGSCSFTRDYKERLLRIAGLLSNEAYYGD